MDSAPTTHSFRIDASDPLRPRIHLGEVDITNDLESVQYQVRGGSLPAVVFKLRPDLRLEIDGEVVPFVQSPEVDKGEMLSAWLDSIDPARLEEAALEILGDAMFEGSTAAGFIKALRGFI